MGAAAAGAGATVLAACASVATSLAATGGSAGGVPDAARVLLDLLAHAAVVAIPVATGAILLVAIDRPAARAHPLLVPALAAVLLAACALVLNAPNLRGSRLAHLEQRTVAIVGLQAALAAGVGFLALLTAAAVRPRAPALRRAAAAAILVAGVAGLAALVALGQPVAGAASLAVGTAGGVMLGRASGAPRPGLLGSGLITAGLAAIVADRRVLPGLYPALHRELLALAILCPAAGLGLWIRSLAPRTQSRLGLAAAALVAATLTGGLWQRSTAAHGRVAALTPARAGPFEQALPLTERVLAAVVPPKTRTAGDARAWDEAIAAIEPPEIERRLLDEALGTGREWNVILISMDTLRADAVGYDGGPFGAVAGRSLTPHIDRLAESSVRFDRAYTSYPTSAWAYASMLSGLHPRATPTADAIERTGIDFPDTTFVHWRLGDAGYASAAVTSFPSYWLGLPELMGRLREGFRSFDAADTIADADGARVVDRALQRLDEVRGGRFFLWVVLLDAHEPYDGPAPDGVADGPVGRYLGDVVKADREAGRLIDGLAARGLLDRSVVVVHADHGEEFGEHGFFAHNSNLHEQQARVPLLIRVPGLTPRRVPETVSLVDFTPTVLSLLGLDDRVPRTGRSLVPLLLGRPAADGGIAYAEQIAHPAGSVPRRAVWLGPLKLIRRLDLPVVEVFDLETDPGERRNLLGLDAGRDARLLGLMAAFDARIDRRWRARDARPEEMLARTRERIEGLLAKTVSGDAEESPRALDELAKTLVTPFLTIRPEVREALGPDGLARVLRQLTGAASRLDPATIAGILGASGTAESRAWLRARWDAEPAERPRLAYGLAVLGDPIALDHFREVLHDPGTLRPDLVAIPLARLGDAVGASWIPGALISGSDDLLGAALPAAAALATPPLRRAAVVRVRSEPAMDEALSLVAVDALARMSCDSATEALAGLALSRWPTVAAGARTALASRLSAEALETEVEVARAEAEARRLLDARRPVEAATSLLDAVAKSRLPRIDARLLAATAMRLAGRPEAARAAASEAAERATDDHDRRHAAFALRCADLPLVVPPEELRARAEIEPPSAPPVANQCIRLRVVMTNEGAACLPGGPAPFGFWLDLACLDPEGRRRLVPPLFPYGVHWLPEPGLLPGETATFDLVTTIPPPAPGDRWVLTLRQLDGNPDGVVLASW